MPVQQLSLFSYVCGAQDEPVRVMSIIPTEKEEPQQVVEIHAVCASLVVTACHRVMVIKGNNSEHALASSLRDGDSVLCSGGVQQVSFVRSVRLIVEAFELMFRPDVPVEAVMPQSEAILTKGHAWARTRRGGARCRRRPNSNADDGASIPDTATSWT